VTADELKKSATKIRLKNDEQPMGIQEFYNLSQVADIKGLYDFKRKYAHQLYERSKRFARLYVSASAL